ncbi:MAG: hypothetical protein JXR95_02790 [Deltaproteobacteria bacterium]|nr:hypothetical protein [Deltaproteobacteria bacterium]
MKLSKIIVTLGIFIVLPTSVSSAETFKFFSTGNSIFPEMKFNGKSTLNTDLKIQTSEKVSITSLVKIKGYQEDEGHYNDSPPPPQNSTPAEDIANIFIYTGAAILGVGLLILLIILEDDGSDDEYYKKKINPMALPKKLPMGVFSW